MKQQINYPIEIILIIFYTFDKLTIFFFYTLINKL